MPVLLFCTAILLAICCVLLIVLFFRQDRLRNLMREQCRKNVVLAIFSHQIRAPITGIKWYVEMLLGQEYGTLRVSQLEFLKKIDDAVSEAIDSIDGFLSLSQLNLSLSTLKRGRLVTEPTNVKMNDAIQSALRYLQNEYKTRNQKISFVPCKQNVRIRIDTFLLDSVLNIVLSNALLFAPSGGILSVEANASDMDAVIRITDKDTKRTSDERQKSFALFETEGKTEASTGTGKGVGFYLVKQVMNAIGGSVAFASSVDGGTSFILTIPRNIGNAATMKRT